MNVLQLQDLSVAIGGQSLFRPVTMSIPAGSVASIIGPSGRGKSMLLLALCGAAPAAATISGSVHCGTHCLDGLAPEARRLGLVFQDDLLFPHMSVAGNLAFGLRAGGTRAQRLRRVGEALQGVGLGGFEDRDPATLSGGQRARIALLRVLLSEPYAVLLDEPFGSLDSETRSLTRQWVFERIRERSIPALLVTHDREDVLAAGGQVLELQAPTGEH